MSSFIRKSRKGRRPAAPLSTPDRRPKKQQHGSSPRGVTDADFEELDNLMSFSDEDSRFHDGGNSTSHEDESTTYEGNSKRCDDSSADDETYADDESYVEEAPADVLVGMIRDVFSGSKDHDSGDDDDDSTDRRYKLCMRLEMNDSNLREMNLECDSIRKDIAKDMAKLLPHNTRLERLSLACSNSGSRHSRNNFRILISALAENTSITDLEIRDAELNREVASWVGTALAQNQSVKKMSLKDCNFVSSGLPVLFMGMQHNKQIEELDVSSCDLAGSNSDIVSASIPLLQLTSLSLVNANLKVEDLGFLCHNIEKTPSLKQLNLSRNELGREGMEFLADSLASSRAEQQITKLVLSSCSLDEHCIKELAKALKHNSTLAIIHLSQNDFGDPGARILKGLLKRNNAIREIEVDECGISQKRVEAIGDSLRYNGSILKKFGFSANMSLAILETVDAIEEIGEQIGSTVLNEATSTR